MIDIDTIDNYLKKYANDIVNDNNGRSDKYIKLNNDKCKASRTIDKLCGYYKTKIPRYFKWELMDAITIENDYGDWSIDYFNHRIYAYLIELWVREGITINNLFCDPTQMKIDFE